MSDRERNSVSGIDKKIDSLLSNMSLSDKIGQMTQVCHFDPVLENYLDKGHIGSIIHTQGPLPGETAAGWQQTFRKLQEKALNSPLGIPLLFGVDAVHGQNTFEGATIFPHNIGLGASRNAKLVERAAEITALETRATGFNWVFSPCIAIPLNEKWGRVYEAFSESTELTEKLCQASVTGHQGADGNTIKLMATAKHYIGDGSTDYGVEGGETSLSEAAIRKYLLPPYAAAVRSGVGSVMASFNTFKGVPLHASKRWITEILKGELQFEGMVVSDWKAYSRFGEYEIINAGIDMVMATDGDFELFHNGLKAAVEEGKVSLSRIDDAVRRILRQKFRLGLFENPFPDHGLLEKIGIPAHRDVARQAVRESLVLLKNKGQTLPVSPKTKKIVVVGEHANSAGLQSGGWTINWQGTKEGYKGSTSILEGIRQKAEGKVVYDANAEEDHSDADLAIICVGEPPYAEFFGDIGHDSNELELVLSAEHKRYISHYQQQGVKTVVILISGRPLVVTDQIEQSDAFLAAWLPGSEGDGIAEVLFGKYNFIGKLPHSWPATQDNYNGKYGPNLWDQEPTALFPFGYGLEYSD
ncbi:glycoside hydrolase family 3 protein [Robiginitalea sp. IMCC44478]|uniref:glycoside hydrolase family 3 protein n=1 Tax=Robiginitalea sp. IMCC44478 TaxID=3459122 RepID=UPI004041E002